MANMLSNLVGGLASVAGARVVDDFFGPGAARLMRGWYFQGREAEAVTQRVGGLAGVVSENNRIKTLMFRAVRTMSAQLTRTETLTDEMARTVAGIQSLGVARVEKESPFPTTTNGGIVGGSGAMVDLNSAGGIGGIVKSIMQGWAISRGLSIVGRVAGLVTGALGRIAIASVVALPELIPILAIAAAGLAIGFLAYQVTGGLVERGKRLAETDEETYNREKAEGQWTDDKLIEFNELSRKMNEPVPEFAKRDIEEAYRRKGLPIPQSQESATSPNASSELLTSPPTAEEKEAMITKLMETPGIESRSREEFRVLLENPEVMNNPEMQKVLEKVREEKSQQPQRPEQQGSVDSLRGEDLNLASTIIKEQSEKMKNPVILPMQPGSTSSPTTTAMNQPISRSKAPEEPTIDFGKVLAEKFGLPVKTASNRIGLREQWVS